MRETVELQFCDIDFRQQQSLRVEAEFRFTEGDKELLLCRHHAENTPLSDLSSLMTEYGMKIGSETPKPRDGRSGGAKSPGQPRRRLTKKQPCPIDSSDQFMWDLHSALGVHLHHCHPGHTVASLREQGLIK